MTPKELRLSLKLTVEDMAKKLSYSPGMVSLVERGLRRPSFELMKKYDKLSKGKVTLADFRA